MFQADVDDDDGDDEFTIYSAIKLGYKVKHVRKYFVRIFTLPDTHAFDGILFLELAQRNEKIMNLQVCFKCI